MGGEKETSDGNLQTVSQPRTGIVSYLFFDGDIEKISALMDAPGVKNDSLS